MRIPVGWIYIAAPIAALAVSPAGAQSAGQWKAPEQIWRASCGYCHGTAQAPEIRGLNLPPAAVRMFVRRGANAMPPFHPSEISDAELDALALWLANAKPPAKTDPRP